MGTLSEDTQQILELVFDARMSYEDTANALGIPIGTVRSRIARARAMFKDNVQ